MSPSKKLGRFLISSYLYPITPWHERIEGIESRNGGRVDRIVQRNVGLKKARLSQISSSAADDRRPEDRRDASGD